MNSPLCPDEALPAGLHSCVSPPVLLNGWKHHLGFVSDRLNQWVRESPGNFPGLVDGLKCLGAAQFDLYTGALAPAEIGLGSDDPSKNTVFWSHGPMRTGWRLRGEATESLSCRMVRHGPCCREHSPPAIFTSIHPAGHPG